MPRPPAPLLAALLLSGCGAVAALDRAAEPRDVYELRPPAELPTAPSPRDTHLIVEVPAAGAAIETDGILVRPSRQQVSYLPDARWSAEAPVMLQGALVETLLATDGFRFVGRRPLGPAGDVALVSTLVEFGASVPPGAGGAVVEIGLVARLVREADADIVASRRFARKVAVPDTSTEALVAGFERASDAVLGDVARWLLDRRGALPTGRS